jgi:hypothetical protein
VLLVWARCPTIISHAMFWAEDGWVWYPQAYADGWRCLLIDHSGYLQTISRLVALLSLLFPLSLAPKVFAFAALAIQVAPAIFLVSPRMASAIPTLAVRVALALLLIAIPGMSEIYVNLTNSMWHLSLLAFLVLAAAPAATRPQRVFDTLALAVSGLSGPFALFLMPIALLWCYLRRGRWQTWRLIVMAVTAAIQTSLIIIHQPSRVVPGPGIGPSVERFTNIVVTNILGVATFGRQAISEDHWVVGQGWLSNGNSTGAAIAVCVLAFAGALAVLAFLRGPLILKGFLIFVGLEFASSLTDGLTVVQPLWVAMEGWIGMRYYFHPIAAWLAIVVTLICDRNLPLRSIAVALMAMTIVFAIPADWALPKHERNAFHEEAKAFEKSPPGAVMSFPIPPVGDMVLTKY